jgi:hypothetical protein
MALEPPIQNLASFDVIGERHDGGVDADIVAAGPIDGSPETLKALATKIRNYLRELNSPEFLAEHPRVDTGAVTICVYSRYSIDTRARGLVASLAREALATGVHLKIVDDQLIAKAPDA